MPIADTSGIHKILHKEINRYDNQCDVTCTEINFYCTVLILIQFHFKQVYLVEGYKPICIQIEITVYYNSIKNDFSHYLWPLGITAIREY